MQQTATPLPLFDEPFLRRLERISILARRAVAGQTQGERRSARRGQSVEFADFRPYSPGDDFRRIDWNAYARLERFFIKLFVEEEDLTIHLLVDGSRSMNWGDPNKLVYALKAVGALGYIGLSGLDRVAVSVLHPNGGSGSLSARRGKNQAFNLFAFLQSHMPGGAPAAGGSVQPGLEPFSQLRAYAGTARPGPLLLLGDLMEDGWTDGINLLAGRGFEVSVLHILAPDELQPDIAGDLKLLDSETHAEVEITGAFDLIERYRQNLASWQEELHRFCAARGIPYVPIATSLPLDELLFAWLRRQGVLK